LGVIMGQENKSLMGTIDTSVTKDEVEQKAYENQKLLNEYQQSHQKAVLTRRDLLATGVISFAGTLMSQSLFSLLLPQTAEAAVQCMVGGSGQWVPLITVNLQGGSNLSSHWLPLDQGGQMLPSYSKVGWGKAGAFSTDYEFANRAPFFSGSTLLTGIRTTATPAALASSVFVGVSVASQDDSSNNASDITGLARGMGLNGKLLANLGTANTPTGNGTKPAYVAPPAPLVVSGYQDITGALGVGGSLQPLVAANRAGKMFETIQKLSILQASKYVQQNSGSQLENVITCRTQDNTNLIANPDGNNTDPRGNATVAQIWGIAANTSMTSRAYQFGSMVFNALNGNAGSANLNMGGYDYHDGTRTRGDGADNSAGMVIGQIIQTATALNKKVFIMVTTDGATTSAESDIPGAAWTSDGGDRGAMYMIAVNPSAAPTANGSQLGFMNINQGAADPLISSPDRAAAAAFVNWLSFNGQLSQIDKVLPRTFSPTEIEQMTKIA
jgi:hypothetical protein